MYVENIMNLYRYWYARSVVLLDQWYLQRVIVLSLFSTKISQKSGEQGMLNKSAICCPSKVDQDLCHFSDLREVQ